MAFGEVRGPSLTPMSLHAALAAGATLLAVAFMLSTLDRYLAGRSRHQLVWTISLAMFALGSFGLWLGAALGWNEVTFKVFYLFGAILNVPYLALGTVYLLGTRRTGDRWTAIVSLLSAFAAGLVVAAPTGPIDPEVLPRGSEVFGAGPRIAAAVASGVASIIIIGGALLSAWRLLRSRRRAAEAEAPRPAGGLSPARLALANVLIATGTLVLAAGGTSNSVLDEMDAFAVSLVAGIAVIFVGFLLTNGPRRAAEVAPWYPPSAEPATRAATGTDSPRGSVVQLDDHRP